MPLNGFLKMTRRHIVIYKAFDVVVVPFPFTDRRAQKRRPALILSNNEDFNDKCGHCVLAMITSQKNPDWPLDTPITDMKKAGLPSASKIRMKLFTLDKRLIIKKVGALANKDQKAVSKALRDLLV